MSTYFTDAKFKDLVIDQSNLEVPHQATCVGARKARQYAEDGSVIDGKCDHLILECTDTKVEKTLADAGLSTGGLPRFRVELFGGFDNYDESQIIGRHLILENAVVKLLWDTNRRNYSGLKLVLNYAKGVLL